LSTSFEKSLFFMFCLLSVMPHPFDIGIRGNENTKKKYNSHNFSAFLSIMLKFMLFLKALSCMIEMITFLCSHCNIHEPVPDHDVYQSNCILCCLFNLKVNLINLQLF